MVTLFLAAFQLSAVPRLVRVTLPQREFRSSAPVTQVVENITPGTVFREVIPSWNLPSPGRTQLMIEIRAHKPHGLTKWYSFGQWNLDGTAGVRQSVKDQKDADGEVLTDTLRLSDFDATSVDLRVTVAPETSARIGLLTLSFCAPSSGAFPVNLTEVPIEPIDVPRKAQGDYPKPEVICSPTALAMVLEHWGVRLGRSDLAKDVLEVTDGVWDTVYDGAGNWSFNVAYAGSFPGMRSYVARFGSFHDLRPWIEAGIPVVCSVARSLLHGQPLDPKEKGHLIVLVGFDASGDPIFNDPAKREELRRSYRSVDFEAAWRHSQRTVYIVHPLSVPAPKGGGGMWLED